MSYSTAASRELRTRLR